MILGFLALGTIWFWLLCCIAFLAVLALVENEKPFSVLVLIGVVSGLIFFANRETLSAFLDPGFLLLVGALYLVGGLIWSFLKWAMFVQDAHRAFVEYKADAKRRLDLDDEGFKKHFQLDYSARDTHKRPSASANKSKIINWMAYWPFSLVNFAVFDFLSKVFRSMYERFAGIYEHITKSIFPEDPADLLKPNG